MKLFPRNDAGAALGGKGFVLCRSCGRELDMLSRETPPEHAFCRMHKQQQKEAVMPAVPKPSQRKQQRMRQRAKVEPDAAAAKEPYVPKHGKLGALLTVLRENGGLNKDAVVGECTRLGMSDAGMGTALYWAKKLSLLKV